jgi:glycosyltransferase involved in cell wall biosynthesis
VSIVTVSFNQAAFLERAIQSVLEQSGVDFQYIVVDAGSSDGSRQIVEKYRPRLSETIFEPDDGPAQGLNKGFARATGEILGYLNADDLLLPGALYEAAELLGNTRADVVYGDGYYINERGECIGRCLSTPYSFRRLALSGMVVMQQSTFFTREVFFKSGGFNEQNHTCWDGELFFEFARKGFRILHAARYWSAFRLHGGGISGSGRMKTEYLKDLERIYGPGVARYGPLLRWHRWGAKWGTRILTPGRSLRLARDRLLGPPNLAF